MLGLEKEMGDKKLSWKKLGSKTIFQNQWISLVDDKIVLPNGNKSQYAYLKLSNPVVVIVAIEKEEVYLIKNYRYPIDGYSWELPQGGVDEKNNDSQENAKKELREEIGLIASKWTNLGERYIDPGISQGKCAFFLAEEIVEKSERELDGNEEMSKPAKFTFRQIKEMIIKGEITQQSTIVGLYLAAERLGLIQYK